MSNNITLFTEEIALLDEVYKRASLTSILDGNNELAEMTQYSHEFKIPKIDMDGLGDYSRTDGYAEGSVTLDFETKAPNYDRGRVFKVNEMDNIETVRLAFGRLSGEFIRTKAVPELDAFRFAKYASYAPNSNKVAANLSDGAGWVSAISTATVALDEGEVPIEGRHLFLTSAGATAINNLDTTKSRAILERFADFTIVPQARFYSAIDLKKGKVYTPTGASDPVDETAGGYAKASGAKDINFLVVTNGSQIQYLKNVVNKIIDPMTNQDDDQWKFFYHLYGICEAYNNKKSGIYLHTKA